MKLIEQITSYLEWMDSEDSEMPEWMGNSEWFIDNDYSEAWEFVLLRNASARLVELEAELQQAQNWQASLAEAYQDIVTVEGDRIQMLFWYSLIEALCKVLTGGKDA